LSPNPALLSCVHSRLWDQEIRDVLSLAGVVASAQIDHLDRRAYASDADLLLDHAKPQTDQAVLSHAGSHRSLADATVDSINFYTLASYAIPVEGASPASPAFACDRSGLQTAHLVTARTKSNPHLHVHNTQTTPCNYHDMSRAGQIGGSLGGGEKSALGVVSCCLRPCHNFGLVNAASHTRVLESECQPSWKLALRRPGSSREAEEPPSCVPSDTTSQKGQCHMVVHAIYWKTERRRFMPTSVVERCRRV
jgi:hypothetical protein